MLGTAKHLVGVDLDNRDTEKILRYTQNDRVFSNGVNSADPVVADQFEYS